MMTNLLFLRLRSGNTGWLVIAIAFAVLVGCGKSGSQSTTTGSATTPVLDKFEIVDDAGLFDESAWAFDREEAAAWVEEIIPLIEAETGREFTESVTIHLTDRETLAESLARDIGPQLARMSGAGADPAVLDAQVRMSCEMLSYAMLGKYGFEDQALYLAPDNLNLVMSVGGIDEALKQPIARLVIAHELTHALQDQVVGLGDRLASFDSIEPMQAFSASIEGHGVLIQDLVGEKLELGEAALQFARLMSAGAAGEVGAVDGTENQVALAIMKQFEQIYLGGRDFMRFHLDAGGHEKVWEILAAPPVATSMIADPASYSAKKQVPSVDLSKVLDEAETMLGGRESSRQDLDFGEMMLRSSLAAHDAAVVETIATDFEQGRIAILTVEGGATTYNLVVMQWANAEAGQFYCQTIADAAAKFGATLGTMEVANTQAAHLIEMPMNVMTGQMGSTRIIRLLRGDIVFECAVIDDDEYDEAALIAGFNVICEKIEAARQ